MQSLASKSGTMSKQPKTLIALQQDAIDGIIALPEQGKLSANYGFTLLNRPARSLQAIRKKLYRELFALGFTHDQLFQSWKDVCDTAKLENAATE